jgi:hypothetical protein
VQLTWNFNQISVKLLSRMPPLRRRARLGDFQKTGEVPGGFLAYGEAGVNDIAAQSFFTGLLVDCG